VKLIILIIPFLCCTIIKEGVVSEKQKKEALTKLQETLGSDLEWEKVHAAEFLLNLGYSGDVYKTFLKEEKQKGNEYYYRIGIWRVLVQSSLKSVEKQRWINAIASVYISPNASDRLHAVEALAKLRISPYTVSHSATDSILNGVHNPMWVFTLWGTAFTSESEKKQVRQKFIRIIGSSGESVDVRKLAAYALRHIKGVEREDQSMLLNTAINEPDTSAAYAFIISSALVNISKDSLSTVKVQFCWKKLKEIASTPGKAGRYEALSVFGELGGEEDLPLLTALIEKSNRLNVMENTDIAIASSNAILCIAR